MNEFLTALSGSPILALMGLALLCALVFAPAALSVAGLTGGQILELLRSTMQFIVEVIREFRRSNKQE